MEKGKTSKSVRAIPEGFHTVTPYLVAEKAEKLIEFLQNAFDGKVNFMMKEQDNRIMHATVTIGDSIIMISDSMEGHPAQPAMLYLYLDEVDKSYNKALQAKATSVREPITEFYGDRAGAVRDAWGNIWWIATHVEDVDEQELKRRGEKVREERRNKANEVHA